MCVPAIRAVWADSVDLGDWWWREDVVWVLERPMVKATEGLLFWERKSESPWRSCAWNRECATDVGRCRELEVGNSPHWEIRGQGGSSH